MGPTRSRKTAGLLVCLAAFLFACAKAPDAVVDQESDLNLAARPRIERCCERLFRPFERLRCVREAERGAGRCAQRHDAGTDAASNVPEAGRSDAAADVREDGSTACNPSSMSCTHDAGRDTAANVPEGGASDGAVDVRQDSGPACDGFGATGCTEDSDCCPGLGCFAGDCFPVCVPLGGSCVETLQCCGGVACTLGKCMPPVCVGEGIPCNVNMPCCGNLICAEVCRS
jgi:hypothetical protein